MRKRAHRRAVRKDLHHEEPEETKADLLRDVTVSDIVWWRRSGDKLSHFLRWCEAITEGMTTEEALACVRSILPSSLIGDHAYGHWESHLRGRYRHGNGVSWREERRRRAQSYHDSATFRLHRALRDDPSLHARLNRTIKESRPFETHRRLLRGAHDVEAFVVDVRPTRDYEPDPYPIERNAILRLIAEIEKGGLTAALRICVGASCRRYASSTPARRIAFIAMRAM